MPKAFVCNTCKQSKTEEDFELKKNWGRSTSNRMRKCKECVAVQRLYVNEPRSYFSKICSSQKHLHTSGKRNPEGLEWVLTPDDLVQLFEAQEMRCAYSGVLMTTFRDGTGHKDLNASLDRKNPEVGYRSDNVHLVCHRVNFMKHTLSEPMFLWWIENIASHSFAKKH